MRIDTHAHVYPARYLNVLEDLLERTGNDPSSTAVARDMRADDTAADLDARLRMMDAAGVNIQVLSATPQLPQAGSADDAAAATRLVNDIYAELLAAYPDRFRAYAAVAGQHPGAAAAEAGRAIDQLGFAGVAINTITAGRYLSDAGFDEFWSEMNARGAIVYVHPTGCGAHSPMIEQQGLTWVVGAPMEDTLAVLHLLKADVPVRFPHIRFHIAHLGGDLPFLAQRIEDNYRDWQAFEHSPFEQISRMFFDTANFHGPALRCAVDTFGAERYLLGSDYPYFQDELYTRAVTYVQRSGLPDDQIDAILAGNARGLYGI